LLFILCCPTFTSFSLSHSFFSARRLSPSFFSFSLSFFFSLSIFFFPLFSHLLSLSGLFPSFPVFLCSPSLLFSSFLFSPAMNSCMSFYSFSALFSPFYIFLILYLYFSSSSLLPSFILSSFDPHFCPVSFLLVFPQPNLVKTVVRHP
jgi:hypothetical protein